MRDKDNAASPRRRSRFRRSGDPVESPSAQSPIDEAREATEDLGELPALPLTAGESSAEVAADPAATAVEPAPIVDAATTDADVAALLHPIAENLPPHTEGALSPAPPEFARDGSVPLIRIVHASRTVLIPDAAPLTILSDVSLTVGKGEHISIVGRSGSGKSTLLNILGMIDAPTTGQQFFDGTEIARLSGSKRDRLRGNSVGFIFQQFNLLAGRTALENVATPLLYSSGMDFWKRTSIATEMLERVGLGHRVNSMPDRLSGGEQQRVAIARALVRSPRLILADEPTGALDVSTGQSVMELLDSVVRESGSTLITITHDPNIAALADRHYLLNAGRLVENTAAPHELEEARA